MNDEHRQELAFDEIFEDLLTPCEGTHNGRIIEVIEPRASKRRDGVTFAGVRVVVGSAKVSCFIAAWPAAYYYLRDTLPFFIDKMVEIRIKHRSYNNRIFIEGTITNWNPKQNG